MLSLLQGLSSGAEDSPGKAVVQLAARLFWSLGLMETGMWMHWHLHDYTDTSAGLQKVDQYHKASAGRLHVLFSCDACYVSLGSCLSACMLCP